MKKKRTYYRTAALLGMQAVPSGRSFSWRALRVRIPWPLVLLVVAVASVTLWMTFADDWFLDSPQDIRVAGNVSTAVARDVIAASDLYGMHRLHMKLQDAEQRVLENVVEVSACTIRCQIFPTRCVYYVTERSPVLIWIAGGEQFWVDAEGIVFAAPREREGVPYVQGLLPVAQRKFVLQQVIAGIDALTGYGVETEVWEYSSERGLIWTDAAGRRVAFGVGSDMQPRLRTYQQLLSYLEDRGISPAVMDVRFADGPTYGLERSW